MFRKILKMVPIALRIYPNVSISLVGAIVALVGGMMVKYNLAMSGKVSLGWLVFGIGCLPIGICLFNLIAPVDELVGLSQYRRELLKEAWSHLA